SGDAELREHSGQRRFHAGQLQRACRPCLLQPRLAVRAVYLQQHLRGRYSVLGPRRAQQPGRSQNVMSAWTHTFGPTLINELRGGWHRFFETEIFGTTNDPAYDIAGKM